MDTVRVYRDYLCPPKFVSPKIYFQQRHGVAFTLHLSSIAANPEKTFFLPKIKTVGVEAAAWRVRAITVSLFNKKND